MRTKRSGDVEHWLKQTKERSKDPSMLKNPFNLKFKKFKKRKGLLMVFEVKPIYPNFTVMGWIFAVSVFILFGPVFWVWLGIVLGTLGYFWTAEFYYLMTKLGMKRTGYKGSFKRVRLSKLIEEVMF